MNIFIDCEWNGFGGDLISVALVAENGAEFYECLHCDNPVEWVAQNVIPILGKPPVGLNELQSGIQRFLMGFDSVNIIADWPEDIERFCSLLITGPGYRLDTPPLSMQIVRCDAPSELPHNALYDARGIKKYLTDANIRLPY